MNTLETPRTISIGTSAQPVRELDLSIIAVDPKTSGLVRDGMCFNKV